ncbi:MAG: hypothetical protein JW993_04190 [Sedimentisphaerales bacterium]|nr:hypothetical protein [Sedimentisphaerales bacterium]
MTTSRMTLCLCGVLVLAGGLAPAATAATSPVEELTKLLPDNVVMFIATSGGDALKGDFQKSIMGRIWNDPSTQTFVNSLKTELMAKIQQEAAGGAGVPQSIGMALEYARLACTRPIVVGVAQAQVQQGPPACLFAVVDAGDRKPALVAALSKLEAVLGAEKVADVEIGSLKMRGPKGVPAYWGWVGNYLVVAGNDAQGEVVKYVSQPRATATGYLSKVPGHGDALAVYYDYGRLFGLMNTFAAAQGGEKEIGHVKALLAQLGLNNLGIMAARVGFAGPDLVSDGFVQMPEPRTGIYAAFKPVDPSAFRLVDAQAVAACTFNCDLGGMYDTVMNAIQTVSPEEAYPEIQKGLTHLESEIQIKLRDGLLKSLAGPMVGYTLPAGKMVEAPMGGFVVIAKLADPALFEKTMTTLGGYIASKAQGMLQVGTQAGEGGRTIHIWTSPMLVMAQVMPTWSVAGDQVIIGSNTALCQMGTRQALSRGEGTKSLLDTAGFKKVAAGLPKNLLSLSYVDSPVQFSQMLMQVQQLWPVAVMAATQQGIKLPVVLPSLSQIAQDMQPACEYSYATSDGIYSHYQGSGLEVSLRGVAGAAVGAGIAMPAMGRAREQAKRVASMAHLRQLAVALHMYANDHDNKFPERLEQMQSYYRDAKVTESPRKPKGFTGPSYIYVPGLSANAPSTQDTVVIYENPEFGLDTILVAFLDGHVEAMKPDAFRKALEATYKRLGREMPEIKFKD